MAKTPFSAKKHDINTLNSGYQYTTDDQMSIEALNSTIENSFYASQVSESVANQLSNLGANDKVEFKGSNPNLLINGDFRVNQRGLENYTENNKYTFDRWLFRGVGNVYKYNGKLVIKAGETGTLTGIFQNFEQVDFKSLLGKTITLSAKITNANITTSFFRVALSYYNGNATSVGTILKNTEITKEGFITTTVTVPSDLHIEQNTLFKVGLYFQKPNANDSVIIDYVKLEIGSVATPFVPRPYAEELALCQRYYQVYYGYKKASNGYQYYEPNVAHCVPMRTTPTKKMFAVNGYGEISSNENSVYDITSQSELSVTVATFGYANQYSFTLANGSGTFTQNHEYRFVVYSDAEIY